MCFLGKGSILFLVIPDFFHSIERLPCEGLIFGSHLK